MKRELIKGLIELASTSEEADAVIENRVGLHSIREKYIYLQGMFDIEVKNSSNIDNEEDDYWAMLATIVSLKWR